MKTGERIRVPRTVTLLGSEGAASAVGGLGDDQHGEPVGGHLASPQPMSAFRNERAFVLLGDPGAGKTTEFERAVESENDVCVPVRRFLREDPRKPEWRDKTLFIDGLDEVRAGGGDQHKPLDDILERLEELGRPRVRISCRATSWLATSDRDELRSLSGYEDLLLLRLDPLSETQAKHILAGLEVGNAEAFMAAARGRNLAGLLDHPLTLDFLARAFAKTGEWPTSTLKTFEVACRELAKEENPCHQEAARVPVSLDVTLAAAGFLATVFLISGKEHIDLSGMAGENADSGADPSLRLNDMPDKAIPSGGRKALMRALGTRLFSVDDVPATVIPVHRSVAEYLAARNLQERIEEGLPVGRVLALLSGADGIVVPSLRGLAAWLATLSPDARSRLLEQVPFDMLMTGDPGILSSGEKQRLLCALAELPAHRGFMLRQASPAVRSAMASPETMEFLKDCIGARDPKAQPQSVVELLFDVLASNPPLASIVSVAEAVRVSRDDRWMFAVRKQALAAAMAIAEHDDEGHGPLMAMLQDLSSGRVKDIHQELRGRLIEGLYPHSLKPAEIPALLPRTFQPMLGWRLSRALADKTDDSRVPDVLDALCVVDRDQIDADYPNLFGAVVVDKFLELLDRGLQLYGGSIAVSRLYDWLSVHPDPERIRRERARQSPVEPWLSRHAGIRRALLREHVRRERRLWDKRKRGAVRSGDRLGYHRMRGLLLAGLAPDEAIVMCFEEAVAATCADDAYRYLDIAVVQRRSQVQAPPGTTYPDALTPDWIEWASSELRGKRELVQYLEREAERDAEERRAYASREGPYRKRVQQATLQRRAALLKGAASTELLEELGLAYLGIQPMELSLQPEERLRKWLAANGPGDDDASEAVGAALRALAEGVRKTVVPGLTRLLEFARNGQAFRLAAFLAGLDHIGRHEGAVPGDFSDDWLRNALRLHYLTGVDKTTPDWICALIDEKPQLVADTVVAAMRAQIRDRKDYETHHLGALASNSELLNQVVVELLDAFPVRGTKWHLDRLKPMLEIASYHLPSDRLREIMERKLSFGTMDMAQRAAWMGIGLRAWPCEFVGRSLCFLADKRAATFTTLVDVWASGSEHTRFSPKDAGVDGVSLLVQTFGSRYSPQWMNRLSLAEGEAGRAFSVSEQEQIHERASMLIEHCIRYLSHEPHRSASDALRRLADDATLASWGDELERARDEQADLRRKVDHRPPAPAEIGKVLACGPPSSAADLAESVADQLRRLKHEMRDDNADGWRPFWNEDSYGRPTEPKSENSCRGELLRALRLRLGPLNIDVQPEPHYAGNKRADIRASVPGGKAAIPVELKRSRNRFLWSAVESQLVRQYARDPASGGHGIYVVLWFGRDRCMIPSRGARPESPSELGERLREQLSPSQRRLVRVIVIDVTPP